MDLLDVQSSSSSPVAHQVWDLAQDAKGTFQIQQALDDCSDLEERGALVAELRGHVFEATQCPHANHVLRKAITLMPADSLHFVVVELMSRGPEGITDIARHRYGCRILEGLLMHCPLEQLRCMVECLFAEAAALCMHMYGNFVVQRLFEQSSCTMRSQLFQVVMANLTAMGTNFYGSAVLGKAMQHVSETEKRLLALAIIHVHGLLPAVARYRHGKGIVELVLAEFEGEEKESAALQLDALPLKIAKNGRA
jgi:mRNA-binding protein PUF3